MTIRCYLSTLLPFLLCGTPIFAADDPFASAVRPTEALSPAEELQAFQVPPGFEVQLVASEPEILKPINMAFDERGRLWVSCTQDYPYVNLKTPGDSIRILEDTDGDGRADKVTTFVDGITHPMGLLPYQDGVIAFCIPNIEFFRDTDGDGKCDTRQVLYGPFDYSKDTHGLNNAFRRGYDGWVYACHGFNNHSVVKGPDGNTLDVASGSVYRFRPDGSRIERFTFGQINPFGMTFDTQGDLFNSDCHSKPLMLMLRDGQYPGFGRQHDGLGFAPSILEHSHGSTAIAGVMQGSDGRFPEEFRNNFFIGNVMTSRINRDSLKITGASMKAVEEPDFLISKDPWFRPVDLQLGPDGALYIADFYNKIIGHYEVPLNHPGRDRTRGRIWRVVPTASKTSASEASRTLTSVPDLNTLSVQELLQAANTSNVPRLMQTLDEISDRHGTPAIPELKRLLTTELPDLSQITALWGLQRLKALTWTELQSACSSPSFLVRIHAQRILADRADWSSEEQTAALAGLNDADPFVQRAAGDALARHADLKHVRPLLDAWQRIPENDPVLEYQLKLALRNQCRIPGTLPQLLQSSLSDEDSRRLAQIALGLDHPDAATSLLKLVSIEGNNQIHPVDVARKISRWGTPEEVDQFIKWARSHWKNDQQTQLELLFAVCSGRRQQGQEKNETLNTWALDLANAILQETPDSTNWVSLDPVSGGKGAAWDYEWRNTARDQQRVRMLSSLPAGETAVSSLRSPSFILPKEFSFLICGHLGFPGQPPQPVNYVRLCLVEGDREIARQLPPRNDLAHKMTWDLSAHHGQQGYLEVVDGLDLNAYAWLAIGGIDPNLLSLPTEGLHRDQRRMQGAIQLVRELDMRQFQDRLMALSTDLNQAHDVRAAALDTLAAWDGSSLAAAIAETLKLNSLTAEQQRELQLSLNSGSESDRRQLLSTVLKQLPTREQVAVAAGLLSQGQGESILLDWCDSNIISPRVLSSSKIRPRLERSSTPAIQARARTWLEKLPSTSEETDRLIASMKGQLSGRQPNLAQGEKIFTDRCATCHQIRGAGKVIGPQLDGIGNRGSERLLEDILDPNRNVDEAFRSRTYALADGRVLSGMFRRQEGAVIVIANNKGEELSFPEEEIDQQAISQVSIMPDNWKELIPESELLDLLAYLMEQKR
ncbi:MAG TPA: PVC-type heme-binding CxxCH protein [Planctomicrobium sp.]|nr:PVC-type heme-binding CxxCH protein [Planctomicrobium sp.]